LALKGTKLWLDTSSVNAAIVSVFRSACEVYGTAHINNSTNQRIQHGGPDAIFKVSPVAHAKAVKNNAEIEGMKNAHLR
jgi:Xaa-Pro aminopeptidase